MADLLQRVEKNILNRGLVKRGGKMLVAVSGGLDSLVLLHLLKRLSANHWWPLVVAHFNHRLRGRASDADERLVRKTAAVMKLQVVVGTADVKTIAAKSKLSLEMAARKLRHEFLACAAKQNKIQVVALAHHADDQVELFFLRLLRGAGGEGLAGMKWRSPSPVDSRIALVRPLLNLTKAELLEFARENKIQFLDDATNFSSDFLRNRIRNQLLPLLRKNYQPGLDKVVLRLMETIGAEADFASEAARRWVKTGRADLLVSQDARQRVPTAADFDNLPAAIQRRVLQSQLVELDVAADFDLIESLRRSADCFVSVGAKMSVSRDANGRVNLRAEQVSKFHESELAVKLGRAGDVNFNGVKFSWRPGDGSRRRSSHQARREFFDADRIGRAIILRHWRPGDRFQPIGLKSAAKLQDLFTNARIPRDRRRNLVVATAAGSEIFWVEGLRIGEHFKLTPRTQRRLIWRWRKAG